MTTNIAPGNVDWVDIDSITPVAQDYIKAIWSATEWGDPPITTKRLSERFETSPANVTDTMKRLAAQGLINYEPYKPVHLTAIGHRLAVVMVRRHRLIETFLVNTLGYRWDEIHDEAERLEHAATDTLIDRIDLLLGHPTTDPHGDPIPTAGGDTHRIGDAVRLTEASSGRYLVQRISDADSGALMAAADLGMVPGAVIDIYPASGSLFLATGNGDRTVPAELTAAIWATPVPN